jgi:hypothetical protein
LKASASLPPPAPLDDLLSVRSPVALPECVYYIGIDGGASEHAVRILARAWVRVICRSRLDGVPCDPAEHGPANTKTKQPITPSAT